MDSSFKRPILFVTSIILSFAVGHFVSSNSTEIEQLRKQLAQTRSELEQISSEGSSRSRGGPSEEKTQSFSSSGEFSPGATKLTREEEELTQELFRRREEGEYILNYELPASRKALLWHQQKTVEETAKKNAPDYFRFFSELGLDAKTISELQTHISKIQRASLELSAAMTQSLSAKDSFNQKLHAIMNDEQYSRYRSFEESKAAVREFNRLEEYSQKSNLTIDPAYARTIQDIIQQTHAYSSKPYQGPFDNGVPQIAVGKEMMTAQLQQDISTIQEAQKRARKRAADSSLPDEYVRMLDLYYSSRIGEAQQAMDNIRKPD